MDDDDIIAEYFNNPECDEEFFGFVEADLRREMRFLAGSDERSGGENTNSDYSIDD